MAIRDVDFQRAILKALAKPNATKRFLDEPFFQELRLELPPHEEPFPPLQLSQATMQAIWSLINQGLLYILWHWEPRQWILQLTESGKAAANDELNPDNAADYLSSLVTFAPDASPTVLQYAEESVKSYINRCYLASSVMLGVSSEAAFLEMATSFVAWLPPGPGQNFQSILTGKTNYIRKFEEFRKRIEPMKSNLPATLSDGMDLTLNSVLDLLRIYRNEAGHPSESKFQGMMLS